MTSDRLTFLGFSFSISKWKILHILSIDLTLSDGYYVSEVAEFWL